MSISFIGHILIGFIGLIVIAIPFSIAKSKINYKGILVAIIFQIILAYALIKIPFIVEMFRYLSNVVELLQSATIDGARFIFGDLALEDKGFIFAFQILPLIIVISCLTALFWFWRILPFIIRLISKVFERLFNIGGPVGLGATANIIMGQVEAPLLIRPYLSKMTNKELLIMMTAGMATVSGSIMVALVSIVQSKFSQDIILIQHFVTASILSIPAAIMYANIMMPSNEITEFDKEKVPSIYKSSMDAITRGTRDGLDIAVNVGAILIAFIAIVYLINSLLGLLPNINGQEISLQMILGYIFFPIAWLMGIPLDEAMTAAEMIGIKTALNEVYAYQELAAASSLSPRTMIITLYGLCGFANFSSVGILVSGIGAMCPERKPDLIKVSLKALVAATLASCMTGLVVGIFI
tara:strand:- start:27600 stop:28829 length:1230 start_codon:yes stop_codon:yes gene_type:complete